MIQKWWDKLNRLGKSPQSPGAIETGTPMITTQQHPLANFRLPESDSADAYHGIGKAQLEAGNWQAAIQACRQAIERDASCCWYYHTLGQALAGAKEWQSALHAWTEAIERDPTISWFHYELGRIYIRLGNPTAAVPALQKSLALYPDFAWAHYELGEIWLDQEQAEPAITAFRQALQLCPEETLFQDKLDFAYHLQSGQPMRVEMLLKHPPKLHEVFGQLGSLGLSKSVLEFLHQQVQPGWRTLETGSGISTLLFALKGAEHHCIVPDAALVERLQSYSRHQQIPIDRVTFHIARSETALPQLQLTDLDLILIDGRHAFPSPFIDWYYMSNFLKVGGLCIVDDTQLWTGDVLQQFLRLEAEWELIADLPIESPNSAVFRKLAEGSHDKWWLEQPYALQQRPQSVERLPL
ncbi:MAG: tetratricopeptide repeat protein [Elainella sp. Prado103]|jgi:tetratricopeptide (TPR) repeat protein|nr:tetratricopeptide repeat protein [Elainella sp. Prado103]